jgi:hypothetical protein
MRVANCCRWLNSHQRQNGPNSVSITIQRLEVSQFVCCHSADPMPADNSIIRYAESGFKTRTVTSCSNRGLLSVFSAVSCFDFFVEQEATERTESTRFPKNCNFHQNNSCGISPEVLICRESIAYSIRRRSERPAHAEARSSRKNNPLVSALTVPLREANEQP